MGYNLLKNIEKYVYAHPWGVQASVYFAHVKGVRLYALKLASKLNADKKIVEIAALLHDVGKINDLENHHIESAKIAEKLLRKYNCNKVFIDNVTHCILVHRASKKDKPRTIEARIIKDADGLSFLDLNYGVLFAFLYSEWIERKLNFKDGIIETKSKLKRMYEKISTNHGKKLARQLYNENIKLLSFLGD